MLFFKNICDYTQNEMVNCIFKHKCQIIHCRHMTLNNPNMYMDLNWYHLDIAEHRCHCQHRLIKADKKINKPQAVIVIDNTIVCL